MNAIFLAILTSAVAPTTTAATQPQSLQAQFDAATRAMESEDCKAAIALFEALEARPAVMRNAAVLATVRARRGRCLDKLGRNEDARPLLVAAIEKLPTDQPNYRLDRYQASMALGLIDYQRLDYGAARAALEAALALADDPGDKMNTGLWLGRVLMFDDPPAALKHAQDAMAILASQPKLEGKTQAGLRTVYARVLLNRGDIKGAMAELQRSVRQQGGLDTRVVLSEVVTRSDYAIAALLNKDADTAREMMAYTSAGRFAKTPFATARAIDLPSCGEDGIAPEDSAIVEFALNENGVVVSAHPVWASRPGPMARVFARAVRDWSWKPEDAKQIPAFFRVVTRVELRCTNTTSRPGVMDALWEPVGNWMTTHKLESVTWNGSAAAALPGLLVKLGNARASGPPFARVPVSDAIAKNAAASDEQRLAAAEDAYAILTEAKAPAPVLVYYAITAFQAASGQKRGAAAERLLMSRLADPSIARDHVANTAAQLFLSDIGALPTEGMLTRLATITADGYLPEKDPLRVAALVRIADLQARKGAFDVAQAAYDKTGLDAAQCALIGPPPRMTSTGASNSDFPMEAARWGFEGWVRFETDIDAKGRTLNQRAIIAYPPFVFREAALSVAKNVRFTQSYRPGGEKACTGVQQVVNFRMP